MRDVEFSSLKMNFRDFEESVAALILSTFGALITGLVMGHGSERLVIIPALVLLIPPTIGLRGNIYASLGSRLGSYLHTGKITPEFIINPRIVNNIYSSTFLLLVFSILSGIFAAQIAFFMKMFVIGGTEVSFSVLVLDLALISALAAFLSTILMIPFTIALAIGSYRWGWNPDNITAPFITLLGDMVTLPILFASVDIVLGVDLLIKLVLMVIMVLLTIFFFVSSRKTGREVIGERIIRESLPVLLLCTLLNFGAGTILGSNLESFISLAGLLIIIPAFLEDGGAIGGILSARISTMLHLGIMEPRLRPPRELILNFGVMHLIALVVFFLIGVFGQLINYAFGLPTIGTVEMIILCVVGGQILMVLIDIMAFYFSIISYKKNFDPDNVGIPLITSSADILGMACLVFTMIFMNIL